ncbi:hypothetical+protein [Methylocapsa aurea]|uniref:TonB-dependent receptor n=1 Tax=Methylocapsa aurea TaxID=663610 RepID=UPI003D188A49
MARRLSVLLGAVALPAGVLAQEAMPSAEVGDVQVAGGGSPSDGAPSAAEAAKLRETTRSIAVVNGRKAEVQHLERLSDFFQIVPNYRPQEGNSVTTRPAIRGVSSTLGPLARSSGNLIGAEFDTGFVIDNVFWKNAGFQATDFTDLEAFELALGLQGTTGGKNTTVGNVIVRTALPSFARRATLEATFASYNHLIEKLNVTGPVIDDKLAYRLTLFVDKGDSWIRDQATGAGYLNDNRWGGRGQLYYVGEDVTDRLIFSYNANCEYSNTGIMTSGPFADSFLIYANGTLPSRTYAQNVALRLSKPILTYDPYKPYLTRAGTFDTRDYTVSNQLDWNLGPVAFSSISAYGRSRIIGNNPSSNQELEITGGNYNPLIDQFSQEFRLTSQKGGSFEWQAGLYSFYENGWARNTILFGSDAAAWYSRPALVHGLQHVRDSKTRTFQIAAYGQATYRVDERLALTFGLRESYETKEGSVFSWQKLFPNQYTFQQQEAAIRAGGGQTFYDTGGQEKRFNMLTGAFNPEYRVNEHILLHALVARGEKAGALNNAAQPILDSALQFRGWQPLITKPETSWDYEIGVNTSWLDETLFANLNFYWTELYNFQTGLTDASYTDSTGQPIRTTYLGNVNHAQLRGIEFTGRWSPIERLWLTFNGARTDARWIDYPNATPPADWLWPTPSPTPAGFLVSPNTLSRSSTRWEALPMWSFNVGVNYERPLGRVYRERGPALEPPRDRVRLFEPVLAGQDAIDRATVGPAVLATRLFDRERGTRTANRRRAI